jgi:DNA gyrase subunit A
MTKLGYIKRLSADTYRTQHRGGRGVTGVTMKEEDVAETIFVSSTHDNILFFTSLGRVHRIKGYQVPEGSRTSKGLPIVNLLQITGDETVTAGIPVKDMEEEDKYIFFTTKKGTVKRIPLAALNTARKGGIKAISLDDDDKLVSVCLTSGKDHIIIATRQGYAVLFDENEVRTMGREAAGVRGIRLREGDEVIGAELQAENTALLTVTENGYGKRTEFDEYRAIHRGSYGVTTHKLTDKTGELVSVKCAAESDDILIINSDGIVIRTRVQDIRVCGRASQGVTLIRMAEGQKVISVAVAPHEDEEEDSPEAAEGETAENGAGPEASAPAEPVTQNE